MKKINNKGFSLVELIVVIAIMAILAVTLAPRLTAYVEKSRKASDGEVVNAVMTATRLGVLEEDIKTAFDALLDDTTTTPGVIDILADGIYTTADGEAYTTVFSTDAFIAHIHEIVGAFNLRSADTVYDGTTPANTTSIRIIYDDSAETITVGLYYDGSAADTASDYDVSDRYDK